MIDKNIEKKITDYARSQFTVDATGHDWGHVERVCIMARYLGEREHADQDIVVISALLHDIGLSDEIKLGIDHSDRSANMAESYLRSIDFEKNKIEGIVEAIRCHRYGKRLIPQTIEGKILQDADRLDAIGAIGIARAFAYGGARGAPIYDAEEKVENYDPFMVKSTITHFQEKLLKIKDSLHTSSAKEIGERRHQFMLYFIDEFYKEINFYTCTKNDD